MIISGTLSRTRVRKISLMSILAMGLTLLLQVEVVNADAPGSLDTTFASKGNTDVVRSLPGLIDPYATTMISDSTGGVIIVGTTTVNSAVQMLITRFTAHGALDTTFGSNGHVVSDVGLNPNVSAITIDHSSRIIVSFTYHRSGDDQGFFAVVRFSAQGVRDMTFNNSTGIYEDDVTPWFSRLNSIAVDSHNRIIGGGYSSNGSWIKDLMVRLQEDGSPDLTFGTEGTGWSSETPGPQPVPNDSINSIAISSGDKIIVGGSTVLGDGSNANQLTRYTETGVVDTSFGDHGYVNTAPSTGHNYIQKIALDSSGKIYAGGIAQGLNGDGFMVAKYLQNGTPDPSFGTGGVDLNTPGSISDTLSALIVLSDNSIFAAGESDASGDYHSGLGHYNAQGIDRNFGDSGFSVSSGQADHSMFDILTLDNIGGFFALSRTSGSTFLAHYFSDGTVDSSFGLGGIAQDSIMDSAFPQKVVVDTRTGNVIVSGYAVSQSSEHYEGFIARYTPSGRLDSTFGTNGIVSSSVPDKFFMSYTSAIQNDGKIIVGGTTIDTARVASFFIARFTNSGTLDGSFGSGGIVNFTPGTYDDEINAIAVDSRGRVVIGGGTVASDSQQTQFILVRLMSDGSLDQNFGSNGVETGTVGGVDDRILSVAIDGNDGIYTGGHSQIGSFFHFAIGHFNVDGTLDTSFATSGFNTTSINDGYNEINSIALDSTGRIVASGLVEDSTDHIYFARYLPNGTLDSTFGVGGFSSPNLGGTGEAVNDLALDQSDRILTSGYSSGAPGGNFRFVARLTSDGVLDNDFATGGFYKFDYQAFLSSTAVGDQGEIYTVGSKSQKVFLARLIGSPVTPRISSPLSNSQLTATVGTFFQSQINVRGGVAPYTYMSSGHDLPAGLHLSSTGLLSGTPSATFSFPISITVTDHTGAQATVTNVLLVVQSGSQSTDTHAAPTIVEMPTPIQSSKILSISPNVANVGNSVPVVINGNFPEKIANISVNGAMLSPGSWSQTPGTISFLFTSKSEGPIQIQIFNGAAPLLPLQTITVKGSEKVTTPSPPTLGSTLVGGTSGTIKAPRVKKIFITCMKGTRIKHLYGVDPVCPMGYLKKTA